MQKIEKIFLGTSVQRYCGRLIFCSRYSGHLVYDCMGQLGHLVDRYLGELQC